MKLITDKYFSQYKNSLGNFSKLFRNFKNFQKNLDFEYLIETSSVFSSNIEGNSLDLNSFMNMKLEKNTTKDVEEIQNLIKSYNFAQENELTESNFLNVHKLSSQTFLIKSKRGVYRDEKVGVFGRHGLIYLAIEPENVKSEMKKLFEDIDYLLVSDLMEEEVFYYASYIHLVFVHIHPFPDGNGRCARILEKWFISEKLGKDFGKLSSEEYYWNNRSLYYNNINLGVNYYELNYDKCLDFLLMLPESLKN